MRHVVVVGASLAGLRAAEAVRRAGHDGDLTIVGAEVHPPYDRPPLSKRVLTGTAEAGATALEASDDLGADWLLGRSVTAVDPFGRRLKIGPAGGSGGGETLGYDGLVIATGAHPRRLPGLSDVAGVHYLRTLDDAVALRAELVGSPRVAVIGAGFIGAEVASSCRERGVEVTVIEALPVPLGRALGDEMGRVCAGLHHAGGATLLTDARVAALVTGRERVEGVRLADGRLVAADVVVVGVGVSPTVGWLAGSGIDLDDGVRCDARCRVLAGGRPLPEVVAAGDVARWEHPGWDEVVRVEHWTNAVEQGEAAGTTLVRGEEAPLFSPVPYFWSDQYKVKIQFVGRMAPGDQVTVVEGSVAERRFVAAYGRHGRLVGALGFNRPARVMAYRRMIAAGAPYPAENP
ncbi:MAG TPA: FAD-dependent oxidoreductase [Acidimicrobiales bacterium]|jgi:3-phenylpropionate/trans-cinnamate dioxygenase ferredoxin reductase subunit|nr:FAD-dependent oxidoreductase [Acidimicrobiales bacterium]